jgi:hypothetical protein
VQFLVELIETCRDDAQDRAGFGYALFQAAVVADA